MVLRQYHFDLVVEADTDDLWGGNASVELPQGLDDESKFVTDVVKELLNIMDGMCVVRLFLHEVSQ